jgi:hypothetical protein
VYNAAVTDPEFARPGSSLQLFLDTERSRADDDRFIARNFLLDENVPTDRADTYERLVAEPAARWNEEHEDYLSIQVRWTRGTVPPRVVDPAAADTPDTFRRSIGRFPAVASTTMLLRVIRPLGLAVAAGRSLAEVEASLNDPHRLDDILNLASQRHDQLPTFSTFWEDVADIVPEDESAAAPNWANELRDRLGLSHIAPRTRTPEQVLVFRYPASRLPRTKTATIRPFTIPTVLDMSRFPAFCPVPRDSDYGRVVNLARKATPPHRELLHPPSRLRQEDLFRRGMVTQRPSPLGEARRAHLELLRSQYGRPDYAATTDGDLL